jgi:hypothetical protein
VRRAFIVVFGTPLGQRAHTGAPAEILSVAVPVAGFLLIGALCLTVATGLEADPRPTDVPPAHGRVAIPRDAAYFVVTAADSGGRRLAFRFRDGVDATTTLRGPADVYLAALRSLVRDPDRAFVIKADAAVPYGTIDDLLESLRRAGARNLFLLARSGAGEAVR